MVRLERPKAPRRPKVTRVNALLDGVGGERRYLEIGLGTGKTFTQIRAHMKWGVDPVIRFDEDKIGSRATIFRATSDDFFSALADSQLFEVIYVDGLHTYDQTLRDLRNALDHLAPGGVILVDDTLPRSRLAAWRSQKIATSVSRWTGDRSGRWYGDVYRIIPILRSQPEGIAFLTIDRDDRGQDTHGQTLIWKVPSSTDRLVLPRWKLIMFRFFPYSRLLSAKNWRELYNADYESQAIENAVLGARCGGTNL